jgi:DNA-binding GntR family transcriptional regulator
MPGEPSLVKAFGVARVTVRRALETLVAKRLIECRPGRGTTPLSAIAGGAIVSRGIAAILQENT